MEALELLVDVLQNKNPALFLGAGFSLGAVNKLGKFLPTASNLSEELFRTFLEHKLTEEEKYKLFEIEDKKCDLKYVCDIIDFKGLTQERDKFLTKRFSGSHCIKHDYHNYLKEYPWRVIFSLNIDDLVEQIYDNKISVQLLGGESECPAIYPPLIKLHGSVSRPELGYVFCDKEYQRYFSQDSWAINAFATEYYRNDIIFLGTEFQENDLQGIINRFSDAGAVTKAHNYFFVTPKINDAFMQMKINANSNFHHICMTAEDFLKFIVEQITVKANQRKIMQNLGAVFFDEKKKVYKTSFVNSGSLYQGNIPDFDDFFGDWDIRYPNAERWIQEIVNTDKNKIVSLYGEPYVGKTCVAMRMALDLYNQGYFAFTFSLNLGLDAVQYARHVLDFLSTLPQDTKCVVLAENMAHYYSNIKYIVENCPKNIGQLVYLVTANRAEHNTKKYVFDHFGEYDQHYVNYEINHTYARNIYEKLAQKSHLNNLMKYADNERGYIQEIRKINDIVEVLYISQEGRPFSKHFSEWVTQKGENYVYKKSFEVLCFLGELGIVDVPIHFFLRVIANMGLRIKFDDFKTQYIDYLIIGSEYIKVRCLRIIKEQTIKEMTESDKYQILYYAAGYYAPILSERDMTVSSRIFQELIKVKRLSHGKILSNEAILRLLGELERKANHLSYYWIQLGIANRNLENFEEANNAFLKAADVRGVMSYNVQHAQAKNYMAWGLWTLEMQKDDIQNLFGRGKEMLQSLITDSPRRYFVYSVHSYTDMMIKYFERTHQIPSKEEVAYIIEILNDIPQIDDDQYTSQIISDFKKFCAKHKINCSNLISIRGSEGEFVDIDDLGSE